MIDFTENPTKVRKSILDSILLDRKKVKIRLALKDRIEELVLILTNIFYFFNSPSNLVSQSFLNNARIYYHNKNQTLYNFEILKTFAFTKRYKTSFFLYLLNLSAAAINLLNNSKIYKEKTTNINQTINKKLFLI